MCSGTVSMPARFGEFVWGSARWGVYTTDWQDSIGRVFRTVYMGTPDYAVARESPTGWYEPTYVWTAIQGSIFERGVGSQYLPAGVSVRLDAVLVTFDPMNALYLVYDSVSGSVWRVAGRPAEFLDPIHGGLAYYAAQLSRVWNYPTPTI